MYWWHGGVYYALQFPAFGAVPPDGVDPETFPTLEAVTDHMVARVGQRLGELRAHVARHLGL